MRAADTKHSHNIYKTSAQSLRRWSSVVQNYWYTNVLRLLGCNFIFNSFDYQYQFLFYICLVLDRPPGKTRLTKVRDTASYKFTRREFPDCIARRFLCAQRDYPIRLSSPGQRLSTKNTAVIRVSDSARCACADQALIRGRRNVIRR